jgi:hypothetical protein
MMMTCSPSEELALLGSAEDSEWVGNLPAVEEGTLKLSTPVKGCREKEDAEPVRWWNPVPPPIRPLPPPLLVVVWWRVDPDPEMWEMLARELRVGMEKLPNADIEPARP